MKAKNTVSDFSYRIDKSFVFFKFSKELLNAAAEFIDEFIVLNFNFAVFSSWYYGNIILRAQHITKPVRIIAHIKHNGATKNIGKQALSNGYIRHITRGLKPLNDVPLRRN
jgi:hypothetical protein